jgi:hypothetical protein
VETSPCVSETGHDPGQLSAPKLSVLLTHHALTLKGERVSLGEITDFLDTRSIGGLLAVLALPMVLPVPAPGISVVFGIPLMIISAQLTLGYRRAWLPRRIAQRSIARADYVAIVDRALPVLKRLERIIRPHATWVVKGWARVLVGLTCFVLAAVITLPIPLGHVVPGTAICLMALGLIEDDGIVIGLGLGAAVIAVLIVTAASAGVVNAVHNWLAG